MSIEGPVTYGYEIPGKGKTKITLWMKEGEYATDVFVKGLDYRVGSNLYVDADGVKLSSKPQGEVVGAVTKSPSEGNPFMKFYLNQFPYNKFKEQS